MPEYVRTNEALARRHLLPSFVVALCLTLVSGAQGQVPQAPSINPGIFGDLHWRWIGPAVMGGRLDAVAGVPGNPNIIYLGHSSGGLFKSSDGGMTFRPVFDSGDTLSIGAIAISPKNPDVVYIGTGEGFPRNSASFGDGMYRTLDGGKTWRHIGLEKTERIARIAIDPENPNVLLVAAMGREWGPNAERGIFRSNDAGATWQRVLFVNETTGASDIEFNPKDPNIVYAGMYDYMRKPWSLRSGGLGSGLYRSSDAGTTWTKLTDASLHNGLPTGLIERVGIAISPSHPHVVYAFLPNKDGLLYRTTDDGQHWEMVNDHRNIDSRPFYFSQVRVDPLDEDRVYVLSGAFLVSVDGGKQFRPIRAGGDNHDLWIDPSNPNRLLEGSDMGFCMSNDRGTTWDYVNTVPMGQVYRVGYDMDEPYHVMAGFQDHELWWGPNEKWSQSGVTSGDWRHLVDWGDGQYAFADPRDSNIIYLDSHYGDITRVNLKTGEARFITPYPVLESGTGVGNFKYRFSWDAPVYMSPHNPDVIYFGANVLFRTADGGDTWSIISPDLTTDNPAEMKSSGGPVTPDNSNAESHCTIFAISEDARDPDVLWAGTDDGNVQITRDGGKSWTNVAKNIPGLPPDSWVSAIHASRSAPGRAFVSLDRHQLDDFAPYAYVTDDYGKRWRNISNGLTGYVHLVREDPRQPNLLYAGTELGIFASFDRGATWTDLRLGLPHIPVYDIKIQPRDNDLIIGTHGRGIYILDDVTPLQHLAEMRREPAAIFPPMPAIRFVPAAYVNTGRDFVAKNKPYGTLISYYLQPSEELSREKVELDITDSAGKRVRTLPGTNHPGINRVVWDLREDLPGEATAGERAQAAPSVFALRMQGPQVLPGEYTVSLAASNGKSSAKLIVNMDPRRPYSRADLLLKQEAIRRLLRMEENGGSALRKITSLNAQLSILKARLAGAELSDEASSLQEQWEGIAGKLRNPIPGKPAALLQQIGFLGHMLETYDGAPTKAQSEWIDRYDQELSEVLAQLGQSLKTGLAQFNARLRAAGIPYLTAPK